jgi:hypothetical protein
VGVNIPYDASPTHIAFMAHYLFETYKKCQKMVMKIPQDRQHTLDDIAHFYDLRVTISKEDGWVGQPGSCPDLKDQHPWAKNRQIRTEAYKWMCC